MLPLLRKKDEAQPEALASWHPNFRNFERLPDTKVIRTAFFVNTAAIAMASCLCLWVGFREYQILNLKEQIADAQRQIDSNTKLNNEALRLSKDFADEDKKIKEALVFTHRIFTPTEFIVLLGQVLPKEVAIDTIDMRFGVPGSATGSGTATFRGVIAGTPDQASGIAAGFLDMLHEHPQFSAAFDQITLSSLTKDSRDGYLSFEIALRFRAERKEQKK